ncbi:transporter [Cupriavidus basilensis OR16]|uniref:Transporter n=1 Tax=Cupriavidus basilensis OR16 TaxID=1127483 RepID=H1S8N5_9BURK|nr:YCF48-related protein [Cupriavidus basilensis]EHP41077.1 transporter [Cupriavidus basilensis OR16]
MNAWSTIVRRRTMWGALALGGWAVLASAGTVIGPAVPAPGEFRQDAVLVGVASSGTGVVAVGERGTVVLSDNGRAPWRHATTPTDVTLTAVRFATPLKGWAIGHAGVVLVTIDGGKTWTRQLDGQAAARLVLAAAGPAQSSEGEEQRRRRELARQLVEDGPDKPFLDLYVVDEDTVMVVGAYNLAFRTTDGGKHWVPWQDRIPNPKSLHLYGVAGAGRDLYIAGEKGTLLHSADGGESFGTLQSPYSGTFFGVLVQPDGSVIAYGLRGNSYRSADRGASWSKLALDTTASITGGTNLGDGRVALVTQAGELFISRQGQPDAFTRAGTDRSQPFAGAVRQGAILVLVGARGTSTAQAPDGTQ